MNVWRLLLYLAIGTAAMLIPIMIQGVRCQVNGGKRILIAVLLTITGTLGTFFLYFVENGAFGGTSFYGAIFLVPIVFVPLARVLKISYGKLMDLCAPAECVMLAVMKVQCLTTGCCGGRLIRFHDETFLFPSQIVEMVVALIMSISLYIMSHNRKIDGKLYPLYMVIYGMARFVLNLFRNVKNMSILPIPAGNLWSIVSILTGAIWLTACMRQKRKNGEGNE